MFYMRGKFSGSKKVTFFFSFFDKKLKHVDSAENSPNILTVLDVNSIENWPKSFPPLVWFF